jgi:hypothetical protein
MLHAERQRRYVIYPPGVSFSYSWDELPDLLADPLSSGYLDPREDWNGLGFPSAILPCSFIGGPWGGGIIYVELDIEEKWMPGLILSKEANIHAPATTIPHLNTLPFWVSVLEPRNELGMRRIKGSSGFRMCEAATVEHLDHNNDETYWLVTGTIQTHEMPELNSSIKEASALGCDCEPVASLPECITNQLSNLFKRSGSRCIAFRATRHPAGVGLNFAIMLYVALYLQRRFGTRIQSMHLLGNIEGSPRIWIQ